MTSKLQNFKKNYHFEVIKLKRKELNDFEVINKKLY